MRSLASTSNGSWRPGIDVRRMRSAAFRPIGRRVQRLVDGAEFVTDADARARALRSTVGAEGKVPVNIFTRSPCPNLVLKSALCAFEPYRPMTVDLTVTEQSKLRCLIPGLERKCQGLEVFRPHHLAFVFLGHDPAPTGVGAARSSIKRTTRSLPRFATTSRQIAIRRRNPPATRSLLLSSVTSSRQSIEHAVGLSRRHDR